MMRIRLWFVVAWTAASLGAFLTHDARAEGERRLTLDTGGYAFRISDTADRYGPRYGGLARIINAPAVGELGFTGIAELVAETRRDPGASVTGVYGSVGAIHDWTRRVFTYTAVGGSSDLPFVAWNAHQEVGLKLFSDRSIVLALGGGYVRYHRAGDAPYLAVGGTYYWPGVFSFDPRIILHYQFRRYGDPDVGGDPSHIVVVSMDHGAVGTTRLRYVHGQEGASATIAGASLGTNYVGSVYTLEHEHSLSHQFGVILGLDAIQKRDNAAARSLYGGFGLSLRVQRHL